MANRSNQQDPNDFDLVFRPRRLRAGITPYEAASAAEQLIQAFAPLASGTGKLPETPEASELRTLRAGVAKLATDQAFYEELADRGFTADQAVRLYLSLLLEGLDADAAREKALRDGGPIRRFVNTNPSQPSAASVRRRTVTHFANMFESNPNTLAIKHGTCPPRCEAPDDGHTLAMGPISRMGATDPDVILRGELDAIADGTAEYFRVYSPSGEVMMQGSVSDQGGDGDLRLDNAHIAAGQIVTVTMRIAL